MSTDSAPGSLLGQIFLFGWIGESPIDGGDFPMLMAYPVGDGALGPDAAEPAMREAVAAWGMSEGAMYDSPSIHGQPVTATLDGTTVTINGFPGLPLTRPTSLEWADIAQRRGQVFFSFTTRPWPEGQTATFAEACQFVEADVTIAGAVSMIVPLRG